MNFRNLMNFLLVKYLSLVDPNLDADHAVGKICFLARKVNIRAECLQWHSTALDPFVSAHISAAETARHGDLCSLNIAVCHYFFNRLLHHHSERKAFFKTFCDHLAHNSRI